MENINILISVTESKNLPELDAIIRSVIPDVSVLLANSTAAARISLLNQVYHLVILDDERMDLAAFMRSECPANQKTRLLLFSHNEPGYFSTANGQSETDYHLKLPFAIDEFKQLFMQIVLEIKGKKVPATSTVQIQQTIASLLREYRMTTGAECVFVSDMNGSVIHSEGKTETVQLPVMATLLSGSMVTLIEAGQKTDGEGDTVNFTYHEGRQECVYSINVGKEHLLNTIMNSKHTNNKVGLIWFYAKPASQKLNALISGSTTNPAEDPLHGKKENDVMGEFDKLLDMQTEVKGSKV